MKRIGMAASKMAQDNLVLYNLYVILLSFCFSLFIFFIAGATVLFSFVLIGYLTTELNVFDFNKHKEAVFALCMICLTAITVVFNILAILINIQISKRKD